MVRQADWYIDFVSPYPYLQLPKFEGFPKNFNIRVIPVLFSALLQHWENKGPAEIPAKRLQTYRYCHWLAHKRGIPFKTPPRHPFNPIPLLRLAVTVADDLQAIKIIFHHIWGEGQDGQDPSSLAALGQKLGIRDVEKRTSDQAVKDKLRSNTDAAIKTGVFGVPTFGIGNELFWGDDVTDMMLDYVANPDFFTSGELSRLANLPVGMERKESRLR